MNREEPYLPAVLSANGPNSAISVLRALKHIQERLLEHLPEGTIDHRDQAALDDLEFMIRSVI